MSIRKWINDKRYKEKWRRHMIDVIMGSPDVPNVFKDPKLINKFIDDFLNREVPRISSENPFTLSKLLSISDDEYMKEAKKHAFLTYLYMNGLVSRYALTKSRHKRVMTTKSLTSWLRLFKRKNTKNKTQKTNQYI